MSRGIGAHAKLISNNKNMIIYQYGSYNLNDEKFRNAEHIYDGLIMIDRSCFEEIDLQTQKVASLYGRKRKIKKENIINVNYSKHISENRIIIENCSNCWKVVSDEKHIDVMACRLLTKLFAEYQMEGKAPDAVSYNV